MQSIMQRTDRTIPDFISGKECFLWDTQWGWNADEGRTVTNNIARMPPDFKRGNALLKRFFDFFIKKSPISGCTVRKMD